MPCALAASQVGSTALIYASYRGHLEVVNALLDAGANVQAMDEVGGDVSHRGTGGGDNRCSR